MLGARHVGAPQAGPTAGPRHGLVLIACTVTQSGSVTRNPSRRLRQPAWTVTVAVGTDGFGIIEGELNVQRLRPPGRRVVDAIRVGVPCARVPFRVERARLRRRRARRAGPALAKLAGVRCALCVLRTVLIACCACCALCDERSTPKLARNKRAHSTQ